jgi:tetratricopeptide (TPR) repeat protein
MLFRHRPVSGRARRFAAALVPALLACLLCAPALADEAATVLNLVKSARYPEALSRVDAALASKPREAQLRFLKGVILSETNKPAEAIALFTRLSEDYPQLPEPYNNLAVLYAAQGQFDKSRATLEKALRTNPSYATAYENLGDVHAKLAAMAYDRALQVDSGNGNGNGNGSVSGNGNARTKLTLVRNLAPANSAPPRMADPAPLPRPQSLPQALPPSVPQALPPLPPLAQAPQPATPPRSAANTAQPSTPQPATPPKSANAQPTATPAQGAPQGSPQSAAPARPETDNKARANAERDAVLSTVHAWARDWSERDVKGYLSHYAPDFEPAGKQSRKAWAEERQARIVGKGRIQVKVEAPQVNLDNGRSTVKFRQQYISDRLTVSSRKTLVLVRHKGKWLIEKESTGS